MHFSSDTIEKIGYYVYRLVDPRNGQTFYVGKGTGNRVFDHVKGAIKYYDGADENHSYEDDPNKLKRIKDIKDANLEVIHIIQRWNLTREQAFVVEAALIDVFPGLSNMQRGHGSEYGVCSAIELENKFSSEVYQEPDFGYIIIKVRSSTIDELVEKFGLEQARYEATRGNWRSKKPDIKKYPYILSVTDGVVKAIYQVIEWHDVENGRIQCTATDAPDEICKIFLKKRIPERYSVKGMASPFLKSKNL